MQIEARAELNNESAKLHAKYFFSLYGSILVLFITYLILGLVSETFRFDVCEAAVGVYTIIALWFDSTWNVVPNAVFLFLDGKGAIFLMWLLRIVCGILITIAIGVGLLLLGRKVYLLLKETPNWYYGYEKINLWDKWFMFIVVTTFCLCVILSNFIVIMFNWMLVWMVLMVVMQGIRYSVRRMKYS